MATPNRANHRTLAADDLAARLGRWSAGTGPRYRRLADAVAALVTAGDLRDGDRLPPERALAAGLGVSRGTVVAAYDALREAGHVVRVQGRGTTVRTIGVTIEPAQQRPAADALFQGGPAAIDLLMAIPDLLPEVHELLTVLDLTANPAVLGSQEPAGLPELRAAIAHHLTADGLATSPEQVLVTAGAQQGIALLTGILARPGDVVLTEETTWPGLADAVRRVGARAVGVPVDDRGIVVDELAALVERFRPAFVALNPHHHNPTGTRLPPARREAIAELAAAYRLPVVEDRVAASLAFDGNVPVPLAAHRSPSTCIVVDSLAKTAWGGLRIGWIRAEAQLVRDLRTSRALMDLFSPIPSQLLALAVLEHHETIRRRRVEQLARRAAVLQEEVARQLPDWELATIRGGLVGWATLPFGSASHLCRLASRHGLAVASGEAFAATVDTDDHVRLPFTAPEPVLREAITRLARAWAELPDAAPTDDPTAAAIV